MSLGQGCAVTGAVQSPWALWRAMDWLLDEAQVRDLWKPGDTAQPQACARFSWQQDKAAGDLAGMTGLLCWCLPPTMENRIKPKT